MSETIVLQTLQCDCENSKFKPPLLWSHARFWFKTIVPTVITGTDNKYAIRMANEAKKFILNGWELGIDDTNKKRLNTNSYPDDWLGKEAETETVIKLTEQLIQGKIIQIVQGEKAIIPHFCIPKNTDPKTGRILKYRLIRDCSHSRRGEVSINDVTPDEHATVKMPLIMDVIRCIYTYIMYFFHGKGCFLAKTDEKGAFREL